MQNSFINIDHKLEQKIRDRVNEIPDFPKPGINFLDISPLLLDASLCSEIVSALAEPFKQAKIDAICGVECRGFLFGVMLAQRLNLPFIPIRKKGKLPGKTVSYEYELEYGHDCLEVQEGVIGSGQRVVIHDDLLATGGTAHAAGQLIKSLGAEVFAFSFIINLVFLQGTNNLNQISTKQVSLISYN